MSCKILLVLCTALYVTVAAAGDPPCHGRQVVVPHHQRVFPHAIHAAQIYADTHLKIVEVPVPAFVFQTLTAYQPPAASPAPVQHAVTQEAIGVGSDEMLASLLGGSPSPLTDPVAEIRQKCSSCHSQQSGAIKGGLALFDQQGAFSPTTRNNTRALTRAMIAARARSTESDAMPPGADTNPAKRLSEVAIRYLESP